MGSIIEVFRGRPAAGRRSAARAAWRHTPVPGSGVARVRAARLEDYAAIRALRRDLRAASWTLKHFESQRHAFPEGQLVAESGGEIVGAASCLVVDWDAHALAPTARGVTGEGYFSTHDPSGGTLYGDEILADPQRHGATVTRALCQAQRRLARKLNLRRIIDAVRVPGYQAARERMSPERYAHHVILGDIGDTQLALLTGQGFQYCGIIRDYRPEDSESCGHAALVVWLNPFFSPGEPPASMETERRKCA